MHYKLKIIVIILGLKLIYISFGTIYVHSQNINVSRLEDFTSLFCKNDCGWYKGIVENGYESTLNFEDSIKIDANNYRQSEWAFFPLYPFLISILMKILNINFYLSAFILSLIFNYFVLKHLYLFLLDKFNNTNKALYSTIFFATFPFNFYFSIFYTESLFLAIILISYNSIKQNRLFIFSICMLLIPLIRPNGILLIIPFIFYIIEINKIKINGLYRLDTYFQNKEIFIPFISLISFSYWSLYQFKHTGSLFAFSIAQKGWNKSIQMPYKSLFYNNTLEVQFLSFLFIILILIAIYQCIKIHSFSFSFFILSQLLLPLIAGSIISIHRYSSIIFPLFYPISNKMYSKKFKYILIFIFLILQLIMFYLYLEEHPLSY
jgi:Gpi18-like mannosyltransferase